MKIAIMALTNGGALLALQLAVKYLHHNQLADVYLPKLLQDELREQLKEELSYPKPFLYTSSLKELVAEIFDRYQGLVFVMAAGIGVRMIAPLLKDKKTDPAVVVMDEQGSFAIPILSGHLGGANKLASELATLTGGTPVITTATDILGKKAPDVLAREYNLAIEPWSNLVRINSLLANEKKVGWLYDPDTTGSLAENEVKCLPMEPIPGKIPEEFWEGLIYISSRKIPEPDRPYLILIPRNVIIGLGCRKGTPGTQLIKAIETTLAAGGFSQMSLAKLTSVELKKSEPGIYEAAKHFQVPVEFYDPETLKRAYADWPGLSKSEFVQQQIGVDGVCEPAALMGGRKTYLAQSKQKFPGITTALAVDACWWWA